MQIIKKEDKNPPGFNVGILLNRKSVKGQVGIEIEVEGKSLPGPDKTRLPWKYHVDHSLRGAENGEYVLSNPVPFKIVPNVLKNLWDTFETCKSTLDESNRTSVHIHLNVQEFHLNRLTTFLAAWFSLEELLTEFCGEHRVGNLFCLRAVDAPAIITHLRKFIRTDGEYPINEMLRYAALNPNALHKFGSIEIRTLRGCTKPEEIQTWVDILEKLYNLSEEYPDPREFVAQFSSGGPQSFLDTLLGGLAPVVRAGVNLNQEEINQTLFRGIRFAQDLCYCRDWSLYNPMKLSNDPFGRDAKKVAKKLVNQDEPTGGIEWSEEMTISAFSQAFGLNIQHTPEPALDTETEPLDPFNMEW